VGFFSQNCNFDHSITYDMRDETATKLNEHVLGKCPGRGGPQKKGLKMRQA